MFTVRPTSHRPVSCRRGLGTFGIALVLSAVAVAVAAGVDASASTIERGAAASGSAPLCSSLAARELISTDRTNYGPGAVVRMTSSIRNTAQTVCALWLGPTSPSFTVGNSRGIEVWNNCYANDQPGACAQYLIRRNLPPGATYSKTVTWDQRTGAVPTRVPVGIYQISTRFAGVVGNRAVRIKITATPTPRTTIVTEADSGRSYTLHRSDRLIVRLSGPSIYSWTKAMSSNQAVLQRMGGSTGRTTTTTFVARGKGRAKVTATANPNCYPECLAPSRLFVVSISVVR